ncbi:MAG: hypothetical protein CM1200mP2_49850 [Planctomycetaceae bacterium]|nr:MAG: hypothetical protein CM1200mP2_49850 [Planctomycetaceae bacterium]
MAVNNLDEILEVDHIDVFFVAPSDLASSMGLIGQLDHPEVVATREGALKKIVESGRWPARSPSTTTSTITPTWVFALS